MVERDLAEVVQAMSRDQLQNTRRELVVSTGLMRPGSPMYGPVVTYVTAIDAELARRSAHDVTPAPDTIRQAGSGQLGSCLNPFDYPLIAVCLECGGPIRIDRCTIVDNWYHVSTSARR